MKLLYKGYQRERIRLSDTKTRLITLIKGIFLRGKFVLVIILLSSCVNKKNIYGHYLDKESNSTYYTIFDIRKDSTIHITSFSDVTGIWKVKKQCYDSLGIVIIRDIERKSNEIDIVYKYDSTLKNTIIRVYMFSDAIGMFEPAYFIKVYLNKNIKSLDSTQIGNFVSQDTTIHNIQLEDIFSHKKYEINPPSIKANIAEIAIRISNENNIILEKEWNLKGKKLFPISNQKDYFIKIKKLPEWYTKENE